MSADHVRVRLVSGMICSLLYSIVYTNLMFLWRAFWGLLILFGKIWNILVLFDILKTFMIFLAHFVLSSFFGQFLEHDQSICTFLLQKMMDENC